MAMTIELDIPDPITGARQSIIRGVLRDLVSHQITMEEAVKMLDHLTIAARNVRHPRAPKPGPEYNGGDTPPI